VVDGSPREEGEEETEEEDEDKEDRDSGLRTSLAGDRRGERCSSVEFALSPPHPLWLSASLFEIESWFLLGWQ
jgi:hypothetical protein